jgi:hypothetical protein
VNEKVESASGRERWPAVDKAYDFVIPSYQLMVGRFEAADNRLTSLLSLAATLTLAAPIFAKNVQPTISFASPLFVLGMVLFLLGSAAGICGRVIGGVKLPDPMVIYENYLEDSEWEFKKNQIFFAGRHFDYNVQAIRKKGNASLFVSVVLLLEVVVFTAWIINFNALSLWLRSCIAH